MAFSQMFFAIGCRSHRHTMPELGLFSNPHLFAAIAFSCLLQLSVVVLPFTQLAFGVTTPHAREWLLIAGLALTPVTIIEVIKLIGAAVRRRGSPAL
jgi:Ca2+-transporting ATPase